MVLASQAYRQKATFWGTPTQGGFGDITFAEPVVLNCRWEDRVELFTDMTGLERRSKAIVYTFKPLEVNGWIFKGESDASDPTVLAGALQVQRCDDTPDLRGLNSEYRTFL